MRNIAIIGGGISGCFLSFFLKKNYKITLFEKTSQLGGLSKTLYNIESIPYQSGLHVLKNPEKWILDIIQKVLPLEKVDIKLGINPLVDFNTYDFPLYLDNIKSISWHWLETIKMELESVKEEMVDEYFSDFLIRNYGLSIYNIFFDKLYQKQFGVNAQEILFMNEYKNEFSSLSMKYNHSYYFPVNRGWNELFKYLTENVEIILNSDVHENDLKKYDKIICTVRPDLFIKNENFLDYKNVIFDLDSANYKKDYYDNILYPNYLPFISMTQQGKLFPNYEKNIIVKEFVSSEEGDCAYIPLTRSNIFKYNTLIEKNKHIVFAGRQGSFKNLSMIDCIKQAAEISANIKRENQ